MKIKVSFLSGTLWRKYLAFVSGVSIIASFFFVAVEVSDQYKVCVLIAILLSLLLVYFIMWVLANKTVSKKMNINGSPLEVKVGDIFEEGELRVINFNEYFDTIVDDKLIAKTSLNGMFLETYISDITALDTAIEQDSHLARGEGNASRKSGKKIRYKLGSIHVAGDNLLVTFSKFDKDNKANLSMREYINCLMTFWDEIDRVFAGKSVSMPLMGAGMTRFKGADVSEQELLDLLIWSFKVSRVKFKYPAKVTIVIHESAKDKINFYELKA